jgi:hypothetical protein
MRRAIRQAGLVNEPVRKTKPESDLERMCRNYVLCLDPYIEVVLRAESSALSLSALVSLGFLMSNESIDFRGAN